MPLSWQWKKQHLNKKQGLLLKAEKLATEEPLLTMPSVIVFSTLLFLDMLVTFSP